MRTKLTLNLDDLSVDSFDTSAAAAEKGTVFGEQCTCWTNCTCPGCPTCDNTACGQHTCGNTCGGATCGGATCGQNTCGQNTCQNTCGVSCYGTCGYTCDGGWNCGYTALQTNCNEICH